MRYLRLHVTDRLDEAPSVRLEWIHRDHIETIEAFPDEVDPRRVWLQLTLTSGAARFVPIGLEPGRDLPAVVERAIGALLERDTGPVVAA